MTVRFKWPWRAVLRQVWMAGNLSRVPKRGCQPWTHNSERWFILHLIQPVTWKCIRSNSCGFPSILLSLLKLQLWMFYNFIMKITTKNMCPCRFHHLSLISSHWGVVFLMDSNKIKSALKCSCITKGINIVLFSFMLKLHLTKKKKKWISPETPGKLSGSL